MYVFFLNVIFQLKNLANRGGLSQNNPRLLSPPAAERIFYILRFLKIKFVNIVFYSVEINDLIDLI